MIINQDEHCCDSPKEKGVVSDGAVDGRKYDGEKQKILFVLKEPYEEGDDRSILGNWHIREVVEKWVTDVRLDIPTYFNICKTLSAIWNVPYSRELISRVAIVNVKKNPGCTKSVEDEIEIAFESNSIEIIRQINSLKPDLVIFGGTAHHFEKHFSVSKVKVDGECNFVNIDFASNGKKTLCLCVWHPAYSKYPGTVIPEITNLLTKLGKLK
ncbi:hypothetical protein [Flavobacterium sp. HSC-61S13]|uniref:hypothetical protein n=1 Tax=Flavobacterium sp. HSC-61S13 TaxID=2910963 RepID=UPI00209E25AE|nr:hypothetical protein [Flavobacterium sp. HSC-61S13]MCP1996680.1 hypothetical protein [Flavobacterium sp. HSC-61S13]